MTFDWTGPVCWQNIFPEGAPSAPKWKIFNQIWKNSSQISGAWLHLKTIFEINWTNASMDFGWQIVFSPATLPASPVGAGTFSRWDKSRIYSTEMDRSTRFVATARWEAICASSQKRHEPTGVLREFDLRFLDPHVDHSKSNSEKFCHCKAAFCITPNYDSNYIKY